MTAALVDFDPQEKARVRFRSPGPDRVWTVAQRSGPSALVERPGSEPIRVLVSSLLPELDPAVSDDIAYTAREDLRIEACDE